eukprot:TRINITY_DN27607_c0_g1_i1.p1 TRINITY_DN27607_c0_g1~~TRINITY_DN27607_c0_g1_i1.p1  ORF type:complete len:496 (+),score=61.49 TRINITY_DN27607_c0_g1_i1:28-1515(+)
MALESAETLELMERARSPRTSTNSTADSNRGSKVLYRYSRSNIGFQELLAEMPDVPTGFVSKTILWVAKRYGRQPQNGNGGGSKVLPLGMTAGPAILLCLIQGLLLWSLLPSLLYLVKNEGFCQDGRSVYAWSIWWTALPVLVSCYALEVLCFRYVLIPKMQILNDFTLFSFPVSFWTFFLGNSLRSGLTYAHFVTSGCFYGTVLVQCELSHEMDRLWFTTLHQSAFGFIARCIPFLEPCISHLSFENMCMLTFGMTFIKLFYGLLSALPTCSKLPEVDYEICTVPANLDDDEPCLYETEYSTCAWQNQNHGGALMLLGETNGAALVTFDDMRYALSKAEMAFSQDREPESFFHHIESQLRRNAVATFMTSTIEQGSLVNLQVSRLIMLSIVGGKSVTDTPQALLGVGVAIVAFMIRTYDAVQVIRSSTQWYFRLASKDGQCRVLGRLLLHILILFLFALVNCFIWLYAMVKLAMAFFVCKDTTWNVTGCVQYET